MFCVSKLNTSSAAKGKAGEVELDTKRSVETLLWVYLLAEYCECTYFRYCVWTGGGCSDWASTQMDRNDTTSKTVE